MYFVNYLSSFLFFFFKQKTAYEMRISDWSSDVCSSDLTFSRLDEGEFKHADLRTDIESTLTLLGHRLTRGIRVVTDFAADNALYCAPGTLNQAIMNIVTNAIDAVGEQGTITVATRRSGDRYEISVVDDGPGVPPRLRERIFEPFFTTTDVGEGTGLGLAIASQVVARERGTIEIRNARSEEHTSELQ